jgi:hypothetical protein
MCVVGQYIGHHFFLFFMAEKDFGWFDVTICWLVSIGDSNIKNRGLALGPKAMNGKVTSEFRGRNCTVCPSYWHVSTWLD